MFRARKKQMRSKWRTWETLPQLWEMQRDAGEGHWGRETEGKKY